MGLSTLVLRVHLWAQNNNYMRSFIDSKNIIVIGQTYHIFKVLFAICPKICGLIHIIVLVEIVRFCLVVLGKDAIRSLKTEFQGTDQQLLGNFTQDIQINISQNMYL